MPATVLASFAASGPSSLGAGVTRGSRSPMSRHEWVQRCTSRLLQLRPDEAPEQVAEVVAAMWRDEPQFHPELAAEMEHESWHVGH